MKKHRNSDLSERRSTAVDAKAALLQAYRAAQEANESTREARQAERAAVAEAREARRIEREQVKIRIAEEIAERDAAIAASLTAESDARELAATNRIARVIEDEAARKLERDRRYANRKARQA